MKVALLTIAILSLARANPCPIHSKSLKLDDKTTLFSCKETFLQLRQQGKDTVTFTVDQWREMNKKKDHIYDAMGLFTFNDITLNVGKLKKATITEKDLKGISLTASQLKKVLEWNIH